ncbi:hypothetical protein ACGFZC_35480 [[Kitasatospora] papulosa]|uniref:hypothetical protein n=1 Tax=Streptomyces TaxID=1883 RepID=UPI00341D27F2
MTILAPSHSAARTPRSLAGRHLSRSPVGLLLPPTLDAFHTIHRACYGSYALAHLDEQAADTAVRATFGALAADWSYLLSQPNLTRIAWEQLVVMCGSRRRPLPHITAGTPLQYDARVLSARGTTPKAIAEVTGRPVSTIQYLIAPHALHTRNLLPGCR